MNLWRAVFVMFLMGIGSSAVAQWIRTGYGAVGGKVTCVTYFNGMVVAGTRYDGVFISSNDGTTWTRSSSGVAENMATTLMGLGSTLFVGTVNGVYVSPDDGATWSLSGLSNTYINDFEAIGTVLYAGTGNGLYVSTDGGVSWAINSIAGLPVTNVTALAVTGTSFFAGTSDGQVYRSTSGGAWSLMPLSAFVIYTLGVDGSHVYAATNMGIYHSPDLGASWTMSFSVLNSVLSFLTNGSRVYAGSFQSIWYTDDNGATWNESSNGLTNRISSLAIGGGKLFSGTDDQGVYVSADDGGTWTQASTGLASPPVVALTGMGAEVNAGNLSTVYRSPDWGGTWSGSTVGLPPGSTVLTMAQKGSTFFVGTYSDGVYVSFDGGNTWTSANNGLPPVFIGTLVVSGNRVYMGTSTGLYITEDDGATWSLTSLGTVSAYRLAVSGNLIYAASGTTVYFSPDAGITWQTLASTGSVNFVSCIAIVNDVPYLGTDYGLMTTINNGVSWFKVTPTILINRVFSMVVLGDLFYLASSDGVFLASANSMTDISAGLPFQHRVFGMRAQIDTLYAGVNIIGNYGSIWKLYTPSFPAIASLSAMQGNVGDLIVMSGQGFSSVPSENVVQFNDEYATVISASPASLVVSVPPTYGSAKVKLTIQGKGVTHSLNNFVIIPVITGVEPKSGYESTTVKISGTGFVPNVSTNTQFNGVTNVGFSLSSTSIITAVSQYGSSGPVTVTTGPYTIASPTNFQVLPTIAYFTPKSGQAGTTVDIAGTGFDPIFANNSVEINGIQVPIASKFLTTRLRIILPPGVQTGVFKVTTGTGVVHSAEPFIVLPLPSPCFEYPSQPSIQVLETDSLGVVLISSAPSGNQWYLNGIRINAPQDSLLVAPESGVYTVEVTLLGCTGPISALESIIITGLEPVAIHDESLVSPNPMGKWATIHLSAFLPGEHVNVSLYDVLGRRVGDFRGEGGVDLNVSIEDLTAGPYLVRANGQQVVRVARVVKN